MEPQKVYSVSMELSQRIWEIVDEWPVFARDTLGKQMVRSSDSISANLKEGMGRYSYKDRNQFNIYSRGSLFETHCWLEKALTRNLISKEDLIGIDRLKATLQAKQNELTGINGYERVSDEQLNNFSNYVLQDMEQADQMVTISLVALLLIILLVVLIL